MPKLSAIFRDALLVVAWVVLCLVTPADAQVTSSGSFTSYALNQQAAIVTTPSAGAAVSITAATSSGALSCSTYPVIKVYVTRGVQQLDLADFTAIGGGSSWTTALNFIPLNQGDVIFGEVTTAGVSCTNFSPFTVALTAMPAAGICYATPSACVGVTGFITGANGLATANYSISFSLNQIGFIGGPAAPGSSGGGTTNCDNAPNKAICSVQNGVEYGDSHFTYDIGSYAEPVVIGSGAWISFGSIPNANENYGYQASAGSDSSTGNTALGNTAQAYGGGAVAIGGATGDCGGPSELRPLVPNPELAEGDPSTSAQACGAVAIGLGASSNTSANGGVAVGNDAATTASQAVAIGVGAAGGGANSVALGAGASASGSAGIALGTGSTSTGAVSTVISPAGSTDAGYADVLILGAGQTAGAAHQIWLGSTTETDLYLGDSGGVTIHNCLNCGSGVTSAAQYAIAFYPNSGSNAEVGGSANVVTDSNGDLEVLDSSPGVRNKISATDGSVTTYLSDHVTVALPYLAGSIGTDSACGTGLLGIFEFSDNLFHECKNGSDLGALITTSAAGANVALSNLSGVAINTTLLPATAGSANLGTAPLPFGDLYLGGGANEAADFTTSALTGNRHIAVQDAASTITTTAQEAQIPASAPSGPLAGGSPFVAATPHVLVAPLECADTSSSATTFTCATTPTLGSLTAGDTFILTAINQNNSGSSTLNIDAIGAKTIKKWQNTANLALGDLQAGASVLLTYDGTYLEIDTIGNAPAAGLAVAGSSGDVQMNGGSSNLAAAHINDNGTTMKVSESVTPSVAAADNLGTAPLPFGDVFIGNAANQSADFTVSALTGNIHIVIQNAASTITTTAQEAQIPSSAPTGILRGGSPFTGAELSGDATTSGSNAVTVVKVNGGSVPASKAFVGTNSSSQIIDATSTVCSSSTLGICKVDGTTITATAGVISATGVLTNTWGFVFPGVPTASAYALRGATATCTIPANFTTPTTTASCGTNPTSNTVFTLKDGATTYGTVTLSSACAATLATSGGATKSVTVDDRLQFIAPGTPDATAADIIIQLRCQ